MATHKFVHPSTRQTKLIPSSISRRGGHLAQLRQRTDHRRSAPSLGPRPLRHGHQPMLRNP